jgi:hypothetical protein
VGHNVPPADLSPFDADALAVKTHRLEAIVDVLQVAIRDPKLDRGHLRALANVTEHINPKTGTAWMSRQHIAEAEGLGHKQVHNKLYTLRTRGYLDWERRTHPETGKRLDFYTLPAGRRYPRELLAVMIEQELPGVRELIEQKSASQGMHSETARQEMHPLKDCTAGNALSDQECTVGNVRKCTVGNVQGNKDIEGRKGKGSPKLNGRTASHLGAGQLNGNPYPNGEGGKRPTGATDADIGAAIDPGVRYLRDNIRQTLSGKIEIGNEFRIDLRKEFTDDQIDRALQRAPGSLASKGSPVDLATSRGLLKLRDEIRRCASYAKENDGKAARITPNKGVF